MTFTGLSPFTDLDAVQAEATAAKIGGHLRLAVESVDGLEALQAVLAELTTEELIRAAVMWALKYHDHRFATEVTYVQTGDIVPPASFAVCARECLNELARRAS